MSLLTDVAASIERTSERLMRECERTSMYFADDRIGPYMAVSLFGRAASWHLATGQAEWGRHRKRPRKPERWFANSAQEEG